MAIFGGVDVEFIIKIEVFSYFHNFGGEGDKFAYFDVKRVWKIVVCKII